ncbi:hypothetical protein AMTRI_Chr01g103720 [Amborella trichopoda]
MEEQTHLELVQRYRRDRSTLLNYIMSSSLIKKVVMPPGAVSLDDVDLDQVSIDYVIECAKKGLPLELSEAIRMYFDSLDFPPMSSRGLGDEFFLVTDVESSGPPPTWAPPPVPTALSSPIITNLSKSQSLHSEQFREVSVDEEIDDFEDDDDQISDDHHLTRRRPNDASDLMFCLPSFATGITDDDFRETSYEIFLACVGAAGGLIVPSKEKKRDKKSKILKKLTRSKSESVAPQSQGPPGVIGLLETMRVQLEISEAMDLRTRRGLLHALVGKVGKRMDTLLIPLELLCCISEAEFSDKKSYLRWQKRQINMLEEGLLNHPAVGYGESGRRASDLRLLLLKLEEAETLPSTAIEVRRTECLRSLREIALELAERPARGDLTGEVCHWADGYHLNVRLYEKLLYSVFDILDEGKLLQGVEEILELLKSTWRILGITETIHDACYAWVLFRQFVITGEPNMLQLAAEQMKRISLREQRGSQERMYLRNLRCSVECEEGSRELTFMQSVLLPIQKWINKRLEDYHVHFAEGSNLMAGMVTVAMLVRRLLLEEREQVRQITTTSDQDQIESYISSSIRAAFARIVESVDAKADSEREHRLTSLAEEVRKLLKRESTIYSPILARWNSQAVVISAALVHQLYGKQLKPFLDGAEHLTEDVASVYPAADGLEQYILGLIISSNEEGTIDAAYRQKLVPYKVESVSGMLVLRWVNSQLGRISGWVGRAVQQERWEPLSPQQRHGSSIVEVYRIIEETLEQFFTLKVPMRLGELNSLIRGLDSAMQVYTQNIVDQLGNKEDLIPPVPILTRYRKEAGIKAFAKKKLIDHRLPDERRSSQINVLSTSKLCVRLNTLYYAVSHLSKLEESIRERWSRKRPRETFNIRKSIDENARDITTQKMDAFDGSRKDINAAMDRICEYTGTKIIFWDLREQFIDGLYKPCVSQSRLEMLIEPLDTELAQLCDVIVDPLRDHIVIALLQASLDGLVRVILDGGPLRVFVQSDSKVLEEDLENLKEFFISGGDGLPRGTVDNLVAPVLQIIRLHGLETRELIDRLRSASEEMASGNNLQVGRSKIARDPDTLLRVLCHRSDPEASQFVKKQFKIPKSVA